VQEQEVINFLLLHTAPVPFNVPYIEFHYSISGTSARPTIDHNRWV
jgi:hypothetical protein